MDDRMKRTWAEISLGAIEHNYRAMREKLAPGTRFLGVVKANAYGHGAVPVSRLLQDVGCDYLAVACLDEALQHHRHGAHRRRALLIQRPHAQHGPVIAQLRLSLASGRPDAGNQLRRQDLHLGLPAVVGHGQGVLLLGIAPLGRHLRLEAYALRPGHGAAKRFKTLLQLFLPLPASRQEQKGYHQCGNDRLPHGLLSLLVRGGASGIDKSRGRIILLFIYFVK